MEGGGGGVLTHSAAMLFGDCKIIVTAGWLQRKAIQSCHVLLLAKATL